MHSDGAVLSTNSAVSQPALWPALTCPYNGRMNAAIQPLQLLLISVAGWMGRRQQEVIEYLVEENRVLKEQLGGRRLRLSDDQRRRFAAKGKFIGRRALGRFATLVTPDTIMRWHRKLIAAKWTYQAKRVGRPGLMKTIKALIVRMCASNVMRSFATTLPSVSAAA